MKRRSTSITFNLIRGTLLVAYAWWSWRCMTDPEPWGEVAFVANALNLVILGYVVLAWAYFDRQDAKDRAYARGVDEGTARAAGALQGRQDLALALASKGHSIKVLGQEVKP